MLIKFNLQDRPTNWSLVAWERCIDKLDYDADIVFFGDSIISGSDFQKSFPDKKVIELGLPGDSLMGMLARTEMIKSVTPEKIFMMGGINSIRNGKDVTLEQYEELLHTVKEENPEIELYVMSILPISKEKEKAVTSNEVIKEFNAELSALAMHMGITYVDLFSAYEDNGYLNPDLTKDGVHLKEDAYKIWEDKIEEYIY